jgi:hypothetical protein
MVWQLVVLPGTHTVTLTNSMLRLLSAGPASTITDCTFDPGVAVVVVVVADVSVWPPPPPPQEAASTARHAACMARACRVT